MTVSNGLRGFFSICKVVIIIPTSKGCCKSSIKTNVIFALLVAFAGKEVKFSEHLHC